MDNKIQKAEESQFIEIFDNSPHGLLSQAIAQNAGIETLERLMDLQDRWEKKQAKKIFDEAMALFQSKCPIIKKTKNGGKTKSGNVAYKFAPIEDIVKQTKDLIAECGFSYIIKTPSFTDGSVEVSVEARHNAGHSEVSTVTFPLVTKTDIMSAPQVVAGTVTFAKRYAFCNAFGIVTMDEDNDGKDPNVKPKTETIPEPKERVNWGKLIKGCETLEELTGVWGRMSEKEKETYKNSFSTIKANIESAKKSEGK